MKKNLVTIVIATAISWFTAGAVSAQPLNWIVPGSQTGGYLLISKSIVDSINTTGLEIKIEVAGNCINGMKKFRNATDPTAMIYTLAADDSPGEKGCEFESAAVLKESVATHLLQGPTALCTMDKSLTAAKLQSGKEFTVAVTRIRSARLAKALNQLGIKHKIISYENAGTSVRGMMGGDTEVSLTNSGMSEAVIAAGGQCLFILGDQSFKDIPSTKKVFGKNIDYSDIDYVLLVKNLSPEQRKNLIAAIEKAKMSDQFKTFTEKSWMFIPQKTDLNKMINTAVQELF
jgi:tripartite-type tricarboxylate transporter receptor subunit TctC